MMLSQAATTLEPPEQVSLGLPVQAGLGLKPEHFQAAETSSPADIWYEVHPENYFIAGGERLSSLISISQQYPLSLHGVGASLGGPQLPDENHIKEIKRLIDLLNPVSVSEHAVWSRLGNHYFADLLPLPRTKYALKQLVDGIDCYQSGLGRRILIENPTNYLPVITEMDEADFLISAAQSSGCGLLLDVNNLYLSGQNCGLDIDAYLAALPPELVGEIHVAGFDLDPNMGDALLIDSHASDVDQAVWQLLDKALSHFGPKPVLLERDGNLPSYAELLRERKIAQQALQNIELSNAV